MILPKNPAQEDIEFWRSLMLNCTQLTKFISESIDGTAMVDLDFHRDSILGAMRAAFDRPPAQEIPRLSGAGDTTAARRSVRC